MTIETATYINDLQPVNPPSTDPVSQGDDHIRLLKQVLQNTIIGASRQWQVPGVVALSATSSITKANGESIVYVSTAGGAVTLTLPSLAALDAGWKVHFIKTSSDANPMFIAPASGTINSGGIGGLAHARRCVPAARITAVWDGSNWFVTRAINLPIGSLIEFWGTSLPAGYEWPNGQTLSSVANYPEYNTYVGNLITPDKRGRVGIPLDNLGGAAAGRLNGGVITGTAIGNPGGSDVVSLTAAQIPTITSINTNAPGYGVTVNSSISTIWRTGSTVGMPGGVGVAYDAAGVTSTGTVTIGASTIASSSNNTGGGSHANLQPSLMVSQLLVVE